MAELETLFSLELDVEFVRVQASGVICRIPAVAFRLMDYPTLLLHHMSPVNVQRVKDTISENQPEGPMPSQLKELKDHRGNFVFKKGKSCLFKSNIDNLVGHLSNTPLYVMVLDMWPTVPKLVGNCSVPLQNTIQKIKADVERTGISVPTVHGVKDIYKVYSLMGSEIGYVSLGFKLLSLGAGLISHIPESSITKPVSSKTTADIAEKTVLPTPKQKENIVLQNLEELSIVDERSRERETAKVTSNLLRSSSTQTRRRLVKPRAHTEHKHYVHDAEKQPKDDDLGLFVSNTLCPPPLFFNSKCEDLQKKINQTSKKKDSKPEPEESEDSSVGFVETHYIFPSDISQQSVRKVHRRNRSKPAVIDSKPQTQSVGVQSSPDVRSITSSLINQNLPILAALMRELSVLQSNRPLVVQPSHPSHHQSVRTPTVPLRMNDEMVGVENESEKEDRLKHTDKVKDARNKRPTSSKKKSKLTFGMTHSQKLRLQMNNPEQLKTLEKEESRQQKNNGRMGSTYKTLLTSQKEKGHRKGRDRFDAFAQEKDELESNKENETLYVQPRQRPVPAPRQSKESLSSKSNTERTSEVKDEIQSYMSVRGIDKSTDQEESVNEENSCHSSKDQSEASSRIIEVHIPSVSNDEIFDDESNITSDFTDQSEAGDITVNHVSPKKTVQVPGFSVETESQQNNPEGKDEGMDFDKERKPYDGKDRKLATNQSVSVYPGKQQIRRVEVLSKDDFKTKSEEFEEAEDDEGDVLEGAHFEENYSTDFDAVEDDQDRKNVLGYAEFEGTYSYDFEDPDAGPLGVVDDDDYGIDSLASLSTTSSSPEESSASQVSLRQPVPHASRLQKGSLAIPKPVLSSKSPLPKKIKQNVDVSMNLATGGSSLQSEFLTGDSDIYQSTIGTGRTRSSDDYNRSNSDVLSVSSKEF
ncbi:uncharacterized protein [Antedon mediterranea]|uniref:uncharacterized protein n=1 Tax=Antedon mediterranea TaxID=105859 RepID=UPI003AF9AF46